VPCLSRRELLETLALSIVAWSVPSVALARVRDTPPQWASALLASCSDLDATAEIGRRCLAAGLAPADARALHDRLLARAPEFSRAALATHLRDARTRDFAEGRTALLDGWLLAQSEIDRAALVALLQRGDTL
jgi:hypothetical protein